MGNTIEFFAGDPHRIGAALEHEELYDTLFEEPSVALGHVDFSMHIGLDHLDGLCADVAGVLGVPPLRFQDAVGECVAGDRSRPWHMRDWSANVMSGALVDMLASIGDDQVLEVARRWMASWNTGLTPEAAPHVPAAIQALVKLCQKARDHGASVVFSWST